MLYERIRIEDTRKRTGSFGTSESSRNIITCLARDSCASASISHIEEYLQGMNDNRSNYFPGKLQFFIGAQVVVTHNYAPEIGVAKGTRAVVTGYDEVSDTIRICSPMIAKNEELCAKDCTKSNEYILKRINTSFKVDGHVIRRNQFGLDLGYAVTDYKSQGETVSCAFIDISEGTYFSIYVMLSRVRSLNGLFILNDFNADKIDPVLPFHLAHEMCRLQLLFDETCIRIKHA